MGGWVSWSMCVISFICLDTFLPVNVSVIKDLCSHIAVCDSFLCGGGEICRSNVVAFLCFQCLILNDKCPVQYVTYNQTTESNAPSDEEDGYMDY